VLKLIIVDGGGLFSKLCFWLRANTARRAESRFVTYLVPYFPVTPTFLVLFVILAEVAVMNGFEVVSLKMEPKFEVLSSWVVSEPVPYASGASSQYHVMLS